MHYHAKHIEECHAVHARGQQQPILLQFIYFSPKFFRQTAKSPFCHMAYPVFSQTAKFLFSFLNAFAEWFWEWVRSVSQQPRKGVSPIPRKVTVGSEWSFFLSENKYQHLVTWRIVIGQMKILIWLNPFHLAKTFSQIFGQLFQPNIWLIILAKVLAKIISQMK